VSEKLDSKINKIVMKYVDTASVLYLTLIFFSSAIINALEENDEDLIRDYSELHNDLKGLHKDFEGNFYDEIVRRHMSCMCFISLVSAFEEFLVDLCILALKEHPQKISGEKIDFKKSIGNE